MRPPFLSVRITMEGVDAADVSYTETVCYCVFYDLSEIILRDRYLADMIFKAYHTITPLIMSCGTVPLS